MLWRLGATYSAFANGLIWKHRCASSQAVSGNGHEWILSGLASRTKAIPVQASNVELLQTPANFFEALKEGIRGSSQRIVMASLYIGLGHLERELLEILAETTNKKPSLQVTMLFDSLRSTRPIEGTPFPSSSAMLSDLLRKVSKDRVKISLYQTPDLTKGLKQIIPARINEVIGVCHIKAYVFDDDVLISGANLSDSYFTNRQDRYMWFRNSKHLANHFSNLVTTVASFSYNLGISGHLFWNSYIPDPLEDSVNFRIQMSNAIKALSLPSLSNFKEELSDTWVFPTIQMGPLGIGQDEECTLWLLGHLPEGSHIHLASAYFNLTPDLESVLLEASKNKSVSILTASPQANGFYGASGASGLIPHAYSLLEKSLYDRSQKLHRRQSNNRKRKGGLWIYEYERCDWTFHAKGVWCSFAECSLSLIGSSNFGYRSRERDLEDQLFLVTKDEHLKKRVKEERDSLYANGKQVNEDVFEEEERMKGFVATVAAHAIRRWL